MLKKPLDGKGMTLIPIPNVLGLVAAIPLVHVLFVAHQALTAITRMRIPGIMPQRISPFSAVSVI